MAEVPTPDRVAEENETAAVADKQSEGKTPQLEDQSDTVTGQQDDDTSKARATAATSSKKKKKKDKPVDKKVEDAKKAEDAASIAMSNVKNLQELITKLSSMQSETDGPSKGHEFWDTQPVPKLGKRLITCINTCHIISGGILAHFLQNYSIYYCMYKFF